MSATKTQPRELMGKEIQQDISELLALCNHVDEIVAQSSLRSYRDLPLYQRASMTEDLITLSSRAHEVSLGLHERLSPKGTLQRQHEVLLIMHELIELGDTLHNEGMQGVERALEYITTYTFDSEGRKINGSH